MHQIMLVAKYLLSTRIDYGSGHLIQSYVVRIHSRLIGQHFTIIHNNESFCIILHVYECGSCDCSWCQWLGELTIAAMSPGGRVAVRILLGPGVHCGVLLILGEQRKRLSLCCRACWHVLKPWRGKTGTIGRENWLRHLIVLILMLLQ